MGSSTCFFSDWTNQLWMFRCQSDEQRKTKILSVEFLNLLFFFSTERKIIDLSSRSTVRFTSKNQTVPLIPQNLFSSFLHFSSVQLRSNCELLLSCRKLHLSFKTTPDDHKFLRNLSPGETKLPFSRETKSLMNFFRDRLIFSSLSFFDRLRTKAKLDENDSTRHW